MQNKTSPSVLFRKKLAKGSNNIGGEIEMIAAIEKSSPYQMTSRTNRHAALFDDNDLTPTNVTPISNSPSSNKKSSFGSISNSRNRYDSGSQHDELTTSSYLPLAQNEIDMYDICEENL
jgi:hypothetical protein